ncbi:unnamed protein product [Ceratitis capitata]|uniref:(Mediterranean fruit fly) hypothetical protein n=1 Tax=Ceratitis capitata TaxID=7213 RepID=A0A811V4W9_CERCA|nr:unnamed protein product [Ceratitis capitata]
MSQCDTVNDYARTRFALLMSSCEDNNNNNNNNKNNNNKNNIIYISLTLANASAGRKKTNKYTLMLHATNKFILLYFVFAAAADAATISATATVTSSFSCR